MYEDIIKISDIINETALKLEIYTDELIRYISTNLKFTKIGIGIACIAIIIGIVIIVNQIKIKKMLRKLSEEKDKP